MQFGSTQFIIFGTKLNFPKIFKENYGVFHYYNMSLHKYFHYFMKCLNTPNK